MTLPRPMSRRCFNGFSLLELMISITLGLMLMTGLISIMLSVTGTSRVMEGTARIQENARFALTELVRRTRSASELACLSYAGGPPSGLGGAQATESHRTTRVKFDATAALFEIGAGTPTADYFVDSASFVRGFECSAANPCAGAISGFGPTAALLPAQSMTDGGRASGSDVLYLRHMQGNGMRVVAVESREQDGNPARLQLAGSVDDLELEGTPAVLVSDCSTAVIARVAPAAASEVELAGNFDNDVFPALSVEHQARAYALGSSLVQAVYYIGIREVEARDGPRLVSALMRNDGSGPVVLAEGVERFDILYHLQDSSGMVSVVDAEGVDNTTSCRSVDGDSAQLAATSGPCGWRSLVGMEFHLLVNSVTSVDAAANDTPFHYAWTNDGERNSDGTMEVPDDLGTMPSGLPPRGELRSHFSTFIAMRNRVP